jgi:hypothetical protein
MRNWDLSTGSAKLELALKTLGIVDSQADQYWNDAAHQKFREDYLDPLEPKVRGMLEAIHRIAEVFDAADHQCGMM